MKFLRTKCTNHLLQKVRILKTLEMSSSYMKNIPKSYAIKCGLPYLFRKMLGVFPFYLQFC